MLAFSPHVPKCSKTKGIMLGVSPLRRWDCEYFDILFSSRLLTANPSLLAPMSTTSFTAVWSDCLHQLGVHHKKEPRNRYVETDRRPDIAPVPYLMRS